MKVLYSVYPWAFDVPGGGERQLLAYKKHLLSRNVHAELYNMWDPKIRDHKLLHFFSAMPGSIEFCSYVKQQGLPLVVSPNLWVTSATRNQYPSDEISRFLELADCVVINSNLEAATLSEALGVNKAKFYTVYNGVENDFFEIVDGNIFRQHFSIDGPFVLNVANVEHRKNQLPFIQALKKYPDLKLVVIGYARDKEYLKSCYAAAGEQLIWVGPLEYNSILLRSAFAGCEFFAMPSQLETPSIAALEAAAAGAKVLITNVGSTTEYFENTVEYLDPLSIDSMVAGIYKSLGNTGVTSREHIQRSFTWHKVTEGLTRCYSTICNSRND